MKEKYIQMLEGFAGALAKAYEDDADYRDRIEKACACGGTGGAGKRSVRIENHEESCPAVEVIKKGKLKESLDEDTELDEAKGRPKLSDEEKAKRKIEKEEKPKGKKGRPKKSDEDNDDSGKSGIRTLSVTATIKIDGKKLIDEVNDFGKISVDDIDKEVDKWEKSLHKKYNYDADITIKKKIGDYDVEDDIEKHMTKDSDGSDEEDDSYSIGRKDK